MAAATAAAPPVWKTILIDSFGLIGVILAIPVAILVVGAPIALLAKLVIALTTRIFQP